MGAKIKTFCYYKNKIEYFKNIRERKKILQSAMKLDVAKSTLKGRGTNILLKTFYSCF